MCFHSFCKEPHVHKHQTCLVLWGLNQKPLFSVSAGKPAKLTSAPLRPPLTRSGSQKKEEIHSYPAIHLLKDRVPGLVKYSLKEDSSNHDGYGKSGRPPEQKVVDGLRQRHVVCDVNRAGMDVGVTNFRFVAEWRNISATVNVCVLNQGGLPSHQWYFLSF